MRAYIAGPMRGLPEFNFPAFFECEAWLYRTGADVIVGNPARWDRDAGFDWVGTAGTDEELRERNFDITKAMKKDLAWIANGADTIVMLPGWSRSTNAKLEKQVAEACGCEVLYYWPDATPRLIEHPRPEDVLWVEDPDCPPGKVFFGQWPTFGPAPAPQGLEHPSAARFHEILAHLAELSRKKQADYGRLSDPFANVRASEDFGMPGWVGAVVRANDKMRRLQKAAQGGEMANESVIDSFDDLAVYAVIARVLYEESMSNTGADA